MVEGRVVFNATPAGVWSRQSQGHSLLDALAEKVGTYDNIDIDFTWNLVNLKEQVDQKTEGSVAISGERYRLGMMGMTRVFDGNKLYTIAPMIMKLQ